MPITVHFSLTHPRLRIGASQGALNTFVDAEGDDMADGPELVEIVRSAGRDARLAVVREHLVGRSSFHDDASYEGAVRRISDEMEIRSVRFGGFDLPFIVHGTDAGGQEWSAPFVGSTPGIAEVHARWRMAAAQDGDPGNWEDFVDRMALVHVTGCENQPISIEEIRNTLQGLIEEAAAAGHSGEKMVEAVTMLHQLGIEPALPTAGPRP